jgi:hypothetical protein
MDEKMNGIKNELFAKFEKVCKREVDTSAWVLNYQLQNVFKKSRINKFCFHLCKTHKNIFIISCNSDF